MENRNNDMSKWIRCVYSDINQTGCQDNEYQPYLSDEIGEEFFQEIVEYGRIWNRVQNLCPEYRSLFWRVYEYLPTHFGETLSRIMKLKGVSSSTLFYLIKEYGPETLYPSTIRGMMKCIYPEKNLRLIPYICRALLVEESVLLSGSGRSWGTWMYQLDPAFVKSSWEGKKKNLPHEKKVIRDAVTRVIRNNDSLQEYLGRVKQSEDSTSTLYQEETINLFGNRMERFLMLRERGSLYAILSVFENMSPPLSNP